MEEKLLDISYRKKIINEIKSDENVQRKIVSYKKMNMQNDNFYQYVKEDLESKLDPLTVAELDIIASVNIQRKVSTSEAAIYKKEPERSFFQGENEIEEMSELYSKMDINTCLKRANKTYKYQDQCALQVYTEGRKIKNRILLPHHYDVIPNPKSPENAMAYVISNFDNTDRDRIKRDTNSNTGFSQGDNYRDNINQEIADYDDANLEKERYVFWSNRFNFVTDGRGRILDKETEDVLIEIEDFNILSPLSDANSGKGALPFIDIAAEKDFEFWVRSGSVLYDTTLAFNSILTSERQVVSMQGHAQAVYRGDANHMPENVRVGVDKIIHIPIDPNNPTASDFQFVNPGSDLAGIREFRESFLSAFLTSRGLDPSIVSGKAQADKASSGVEKLLQMIDKFEASQEDFSLFRCVEHKLCKIIAAFTSSDIDLDEDYRLNINPEDIECHIEYARPELIKSEMEELELLEKEIEIGVNSRVHYLIDKGMSKEQAMKKLAEIDKFEQGMSLNGNPQTENLEKPDTPEIQS